MTLTLRFSGGPAQDGPRGLHVVSPAPREVWRHLLCADPGALPTQTPEWTDWLCRTRGWTDASRLYEVPGGRRLLLPLVARVQAGLPVTAESMPYGFGYGGPLVEGGKVTEAEAATVLSDLAGHAVLRARIAPDPVIAETWNRAAPRSVVRVQFLAHVLDLEGGFDHVWSKRYRQGARRKVRRADKQPLDVRQVRDGRLVEAFTELNRRSVERWARHRGHPLWLASLVERRRDRVGQLASALPALGSTVTGWTAHLHGEPVAAYVALRHGEQAYFWMSAMDKALAERTDAGALLQSLAIEEACAAGARCFQLGESDPGSGVAAFKERFGATPVPWTAVHVERLPLTAARRGIRALAGRLDSTGRTRAATDER